MTAEYMRLEEVRKQTIPWKKWGPYLSERQWGTVREDYSEGGGAWNYFPHGRARSRTYRRGEDGIAGLADDKQRIWRERERIHSPARWSKEIVNSGHNPPR